uniref:Pecanex-like protein n=1 Tax=Gongylonema pulchrum TaxID=637853 RepID=A0A183E3Z0_9BILA
LVNEVGHSVNSFLALPETSRDGNLRSRSHEDHQVCLLPRVPTIMHTAGSLVNEVGHSVNSFLALPETSRDGNLRSRSHEDHQIRDMEIVESDSGDSVKRFIPVSSVPVSTAFSNPPVLAAVPPPQVAIPQTPPPSITAVSFSSNKCVVKLRVSIKELICVEAMASAKQNRAFSKAVWPWRRKRLSHDNYMRR